MVLPILRNLRSASGIANHAATDGSLAMQKVPRSWYHVGGLFQIAGFPKYTKSDFPTMLHFYLFGWVH